jgi:hypothetical protein
MHVHRKKSPNEDYLLDDRRDARLTSYDDLFKQWEKVLQFQIRGTDATET